MTYHVTQLHLPTFLLSRDKLSLAQNKTIVTIDVHNYSYGIDAYTFTKQPVIINGEPWGIQFTASKVKDWINMTSFAEVLAADKSNLSFSTTRAIRTKINTITRNCFILVITRSTNETNSTANSSDTKSSRKTNRKFSH